MTKTGIPQTDYAASTKRSSLTVDRLHEHLPIFWIRTEKQCLLYAAGTAAPVPACDVDSLRRHWLGAEAIPERLAQFARELQEHAEERCRLWTAVAQAPYRPESLIVHLGNACTLACDYCYAARRDPAGRRHRAAEQVSLEAVSAAAKLVAANCRERAIPLRLAIHGGGEPTVDVRHTEACVREVQRVVMGYGIGLETYLATNGQMPRIVAQRLARRFHCVGLSCDGPRNFRIGSVPDRMAADRRKLYCKRRRPWPSMAPVWKSARP